jgi:hypothetical protein
MPFILSLCSRLVPRQHVRWPGGQLCVHPVVVGIVGLMPRWGESQCNVGV